MSELPPTQDVNDIPGMDAGWQSSVQVWGRLLPLKPKMPTFAMSKDSYTVGREETCDLVLNPYMFDQSSHVNAISKKHFRIDRVSFDFNR
ncbi:unnamed protein product [Mesocestoides corti]|uniref:FHA domain-containing protein n=1 Tax=Mesocestoides corti TaxID=53468 RepID=A0A0R3URU1_MESCO|nr:unnamed protein product [Mesocestoides corti]